MIRHLDSEQQEEQGQQPITLKNSYNSCKAAFSAERSH